VVVVGALALPHSWYNPHNIVQILDIRNRIRVDRLYRSYCWRLSR
jgi:hypothetical protein